MEKLNSTAIEQLISRYKQELEKLHFQTLKTQETIQELEEGLRVAKAKEATVLQEMRDKQEQAAEEVVAAAQTSSSAEKSAAAPATKSPPRKKRTKSKTKAKAKVGRPRKKTKKKKTKTSSNDRSKGYRLSPVDELVLEALAAREMPLKTAELHEYSAAHMGEKGESYDDERLRLLISRSLQKLANRRDDVVKLRNPNERGHLYALPNWLSGSGEEKKLKKKFERK